MPLRRSPRLTPALLQANRRNAQKSTGPRTARGKQAVRLSRLAMPGRPVATSRLTLPEQLELAQIYASLYYAMAAEPHELFWLEKFAALIWQTKRLLERGVRDPAFRRREARRWRLPVSPFKMQWVCSRAPGRREWRVSVALGLRQARSRAGVTPLPPSEWDGRRGLHVQLVVRCSLGRTWRPRRPDLRADPPVTPVGAAPDVTPQRRNARRTRDGGGQSKPECSG